MRDFMLMVAASAVFMAGCTGVPERPADYAEWDVSCQYYGLNEQVREPGSVARNSSCSGGGSGG